MQLLHCQHHVQEVRYDLGLFAVELDLLCEALYTRRGQVCEIVYQHATPLESFDVNGPHVLSHHVYHKLVPHATRLLCILDQVPGKELDTMVLRPRPHVGEREVAIIAGPYPLGLLDYLAEDGEGVPITLR